MEPSLRKWGLSIIKSSARGSVLELALHSRGLSPGLALHSEGNTCCASMLGDPGLCIQEVGNLGHCAEGLWNLKEEPTLGAHSASMVMCAKLGSVVLLVSLFFDALGCIMHALTFQSLLPLCSAWPKTHLMSATQSCSFALSDAMHCSLQPRSVLSF